MKNMIGRKMFLLAIIVMVGCTSKSSVQFNASSPAPNFSKVLNPLDSLTYYAQLSEISYEDDAISQFQALGFDVTYYYITRNQPFFKYPELYILSRAEKPAQMTLVFVGTNSWFDWAQNLKFLHYTDRKVDKYFFIPSGHGGFRRGVLNLINTSFYKNGLDKHRDSYGIARQAELVIVGHSQGGGVAQMVTPYLAGYQYINQQPQLIDRWDYSVSKVITIGAPPAVDCISQPFMQETFGSITINIIRDEDLVSTAHKPKDKWLKNVFYGRLLRITRDGETRYENTEWGVNDALSFDPHGIVTYVDALKRYETPDNYKPPVPMPCKG